MMSLERIMFCVGERPFECYMLIITRENGEKEFWFKGRDVAEFLGYVIPHKAVRDNVPAKYRKNWTELTNELQETILDVPSNWHPNTGFITESGVYALIFGSKLPEAIKFYEWVYEDVLPSIRKYGVYTISTDQPLVKCQCNSEIQVLERKNKEIEFRNQLALEYNDKLLEKEKEFNDKLLEKEQELNTKLLEKEQDFNTKLQAKEQELNAKLVEKDQEIKNELHSVINMAEEAISAKDKTIELAEQTIRSKDASINRLKPLAILKPNNKNKRHQFSAFHQPSDDPRFPNEYTYSRTQLRNAKKSVEKIMRDSSNKRRRIYYREEEANPINVPNKIKEHYTRINYKIVKPNSIKCAAPPEEMVELIESLSKKLDT